MQRKKLPSAFVTNTLWCCAIIVLLMGCNRGPHLVKVHGKVTVKGKPLEQGVVMFYPTSGRPATGQINSDGTYRLTTLAPGDGAEPGEYRVTVDAVDVKESAPPPTSLEEEIAQGTSGKPAPRAIVRYLAPEQYADPTSTPLKATVADQENEINFDIP
jgi:hypothetical protein